MTQIVFGQTLRPVATASSVFLNSRFRPIAPPYRRIAADVNLSLGTVMRIAAAAAAPRSNAPSIRRAQAMPDMVVVKRQLARGWPMRKIWRRYAETTPGAYSECHFAAIVRNALGHTVYTASLADRSSYDLKVTNAEDAAAEQYWADRASIEERRARTRIIEGYGASIKVRRRELVIYETGRETSYLPGTHGLAAVIIQAPAASITTDAVRWLAAQSVAVIFQDCYGELLNVVTACNPGTVPLRRAQYTASLTPLPLARRIVCQKLASARAHGVFTASEAAAFQAAARTAAAMTDLLVIEARAAVRYWAARQLTLKHKPANWPVTWTHFTRRHSPISNTPRNAAHPVNAILNYGYSVLAGQLHRALAAAGLDPACGFLHADKDGRASLVYDAMELLRADVDSRLLKFAAAQTWKRADFPVEATGVVRLQPGLARTVAALAMTPQKDVERAIAWFVDAVQDCAVE